MRRSLTSLLVLCLAGLGLLVVPSAASAAPYCGQVWGSTAKSDPGLPSGRLTGIRVGRHDCFDRLVLDANVPITGWSVRYVSVVTADPSGLPVGVQGGARLQIVVQSGVSGSWFVSPPRQLASTAGFRTFRDVKAAGTFEGVTTIGLGVRARLPFRAFVLAGPGSGSRLVVDVGHQWCATGTTC